MDTTIAIVTAAYGNPMNKAISNITSPFLNVPKVFYKTRLIRSNLRDGDFQNVQGLKLILQDGTQRLQHDLKLGALLGSFLRFGRFRVLVEAAGFGATRHAIQNGKQRVAGDLLGEGLVFRDGEEVQDDGKMVG